MKRLVIRIHHSSHPPYRLKLRPGTKVSDVLAYLHLGEDYVLSPADDPSKTFIPEEELYSKLQNDQKLIATLSPEAVAKYAHTFLP